MFKTRSSPKKLSQRKRPTEVRSNRAEQADRPLGRPAGRQQHQQAFGSAWRVSKQIKPLCICEFFVPVSPALVLSFLVSLQFLSRVPLRDLFFQRRKRDDDVDDDDDDDDDGDEVEADEQETKQASKRASEH